MEKLEEIVDIGGAKSKGIIITEIKILMLETFGKALEAKSVEEMAEIFGKEVEAL